MGNTLKLTVLERERAVTEVEALKPFLVEAALRSAGRYSPQDLADAVKSGTVVPCVVWSPEDQEIASVALLEAVQAGRKRVARLELVGGAQIDEWGHLWPALLHVAEQLRFDQLEVAGELCWGDVLQGAVPTSTTWLVNLEGEE